MRFFRLDELRNVKLFIILGTCFFKKSLIIYGAKFFVSNVFIYKKNINKNGIITKNKITTKTIIS